MLRLHSIKPYSVLRTIQHTYIVAIGNGDSAQASLAMYHRVIVALLAMRN